MRSLLFLFLKRCITASSDRTISHMTALCFFSGLITSCALTVIMCVMYGFEQKTEEQLQGIHAQAVIRAFGNELNVPAIAQILHTEFPQVTAYSATTIQQCIIQPIGSDDITNLVAIHAIDPTTHEQVSTLSHKIITPTPPPPLATILDDQQIIIGKTLATDLSLSVHDLVYLVYPAPDQDNMTTIHLERSAVRIGGIFATGIDEFDATLIFCSFSLLQKIWPEQGATELHLSIAPATSIESTVTALRDRFNIQVFTWKDLYPSLVSALALEKFIMVLLLFFIMVITALSFIALEFMFISHKKNTIALLKAMGLSVAKIQLLFLCAGLLITACATIAGLLVAYIICLLLQQYQCIPLPDIYYSCTVPVMLECSLFVFLFCAIVGVTACALWIPVRSIASLQVTTILKGE